MADKMELVIDYPSQVAAKLLSDEIDVGLVPVAIIPSLPHHDIIADYCIGCDGEVASVCLFSDLPLNEIKTILLDYQSRTSVALLKVLLKEHWKISPALINAGEAYEKEITGTTAGLVIGDRALGQRAHSKYIYDLGLAWKEMTGLPFVFAAWISNKAIDESFRGEFNRSNKFGLDHLDKVIQQTNYQFYDLEKYYKENISYQLDDRKKKGLDLFLRYIS